jgi:hypothetical protein
MSDDGLFIKNISTYIQFITLILAIVLYKKYKHYTFYKFFITYLINIAFFEFLANVVFIKNNFVFFNIYTFFEFNFFALIYYHLIEDKNKIKLIKLLVLIFNIIYFTSYYFTLIQMYTVSIEGVFNSALIIIYFIELLNSKKILNYKKLLPFWLSVGFLLFYLTSVPFFTLLYSNLFDSRVMFPILYYLIIVFHLSLIYGLVACKKTKE